MKGALAKGAPVGAAGCAVTQDRCIDAVTRAERTFAEVLAEILRIERLSVESHFFDELGADSLVMAKFCARVRKREDLPSVSMKDIYRHPTIRSLAAAVADAVPPAEANSPTAGALELPPPDTDQRARARPVRRAASALLPRVFVPRRVRCRRRLSLAGRRSSRRRKGSAPGAVRQHGF